MDTSDRSGPIPVRELMSHLSGASEAASGRDPSSPAEAPADRDVAFEADGVRWLAREAGKSTWGTDLAAAPVAVAIHFFHPERPARPAREALLPRGRLRMLFPEELVALFEGAADVPPEGTAVARPRRGGRGPRRGTGPGGRRPQRDSRNERGRGS
jgi:hypothetical protein